MKRRIVVARRGGTVAQRPRVPGRPLAPFRDPGDSQCPAPEPAGVIGDGWHRDVTLCREFVTPGWGTRFGGAPEGSNLVSGGTQVWHPPGESPPFATPAAAPGFSLPRCQGR